jgi:DNA mismatch repair protein MutS
VPEARAPLVALVGLARAAHAQIDLFAPPAAPAAAPAPSALALALEALEPDRLSPREALEALYRLKALAAEPHDGTAVDTLGAST